MNNFLRLVTCLAAVVVAATLLFYWELRPGRHFAPSNLPVLVGADTDSFTKIGGGKPAKGLKQEVVSEQLTGSFNVLVLGIDARKQESSRTDVIILTNICPEQGQVNIITIPRDTRVFIPGTGHTKINHAHLLGETRGGNNGGTRAALEAVSDLLQCNIKYYVKLNFQGFEKIVDAVGGVDIDLPYPVRLTFIDETLPAGKQHLNGYLALKLVRERFSLPEGDLGRQRFQFDVLKAVARKAYTTRSMARLIHIYRQVRGEVMDTNFGESDVISLALMFQGMSFDDIKHIQLPGQGEYALDPLIKKRVYYWSIDTGKAGEIIPGITRNDEALYSAGWPLPLATQQMQPTLWPWGWRDESSAGGRPFEYRPR